VPPPTADPTTAPPVTTAAIATGGAAALKARPPVRRDSRATQDQNPEPQPEVTPPPTAPAVAAATGRLQLDSTPYAVVFLGARRLGITPIDVELPAGPHTLTLRNPEQQIETTYRVTIAADEVVSRRVALE
jgi:hypothetical protein